MPHTTDMNEELMTKFSVALYFKVSERTIERWEKLGMPVINIGGTKRYKISEILEWSSLNEFNKAYKKITKKIPY